LGQSIGSEQVVTQRLGPLEHHAHFHDALSIVKKLQAEGFQALFAGGCVRDAWLGVSAVDIDIATSAKPDDIERLFPKTLAVGKAFGTMVVVKESGQFEVTTFRKDGDYLDGRHPENVTFSDAEEDAKRRDFTINALFYDPIAHQTIDYVGGIKDLNQRVIRTVGVAADRFNEDQLRLLRAVRFSSQLGFDIELKTWKSVEELSPKIKNVSRERVWQELLKLLKGKSARLGLERLVRSRLAGGGVWPTLQAMHDDPVTWKLFVERIKWLHSPETFMAIFATLTKDIAAFYRDLESLKPPRHFTQAVKHLAQVHEQLWKNETKRSERVRILGAEDSALVLEMSEAEAEAAKNSNMLEGWIAEYLKICDKQGNLPKAFLTGEELLKLGFKAGPLLGKVLEEAYSLQLEGEISSQMQAVQFAQKRLGETNT